MFLKVGLSDCMFGAINLLLCLINLCIIWWFDLVIDDVLIIDDVID